MADETPIEDAETYDCFLCLTETQQEAALYARLVAIEDALEALSE